jgi:spore maturation protein SpmB
MSSSQNQLKRAFLAGVKKGWRTFIWICQIVIPISLLVTILQWTGWLNRLDFLLNPFMSLFNLPSQAALPIISGMVFSIYATVAMIAVIPFSVEQMTLIAVFNLIAHSLIMEGIVQHKSGFNVFKAALSRIFAATITVFIISQFMGDTSQSVVIPISLTSSTPILEVLRSWVIDTIYLLLRILGIVMVIMILQEYLTSLGWLDGIQRFFRHFMRIMGLSQKTTLIWLAANIFGLLYGGGVIMEESKKGILTRDELEHLHISIGISHSMTEDPFIFAVLGLPPLWLWIPRFLMAIVAVQSYRLIKLLKRKLIHQASQ